MKRFNSKFTLDQTVLINCRQKKLRLYYALLFKYYEIYQEFFNEVPKAFSVNSIARKLKLSTKVTIPSLRIRKQCRKEIRKYFNISNTSAYKEALRSYLREIIATEGVFDTALLQEYALSFLSKRKIDNIPLGILNRISKSALYQYEKELFQDIAQALDIRTKAHLDNLLTMKEGISYMTHLSRWLNGIKVDNIKLETEKLKFLKLLNYPKVIIKLTSKHLKRYYRSICIKYPSAIKEMPESHKYALLAIFCFVRKTEISDALAEILMNITHKTFIAGENKSKNQLSKFKELKKNYDNKKILKTLINVILDNENGIIKDVIYPQLSKQKLKQIQIQITDKTANTFSDLSYDNSRESFIRYYRRIIVPILEVLEFNSSNCKELVQVLNTFKENLNNRSKYYSKDIIVEKVIRKSHTNKVKDSNDRIKRVDLELCVLHKLRNKLRIKEVWIEDGYKYRNPEEDLPQDFHKNKEKYFNMLSQSQSVKAFIKEIKGSLKTHLSFLNKNLPINQYVQILKKGHIKVAKLKEQDPPEKLELIKNEVFKRWPGTNLLDVLKETDLFVNFTDDFVSCGSKVGLDKESIKKRLLLTILGYGTNTGLKSMSNEEISYQDLQYIKLRYFEPENLRNAIRKVVNNLLKIRLKELWENSTTSVASDSKHFQASDQNLMSSWHPRYHSKGVMIYWHVDTSSVCIYSQLKTCTSSEVSAMLEGILKHCTDVSIERNYVDTHGASEVGFAFAHLFNFALMPRFSNIHMQKLYCADKEDFQNYKNLEDIMIRPINWSLIEKNYDSIIQHAVALKLGTADTESLMRKFTRHNLQHETYQAIRELGRALKTIFLCQYLSSIELRQEINSALNVVECWNSVNDFIFYGKTGAFRSNNPLELKLSMLCLHLLQLSMVYINTLMLQQVLVESNWLEKMTIEDKRAISPLINAHINPYGDFHLDLNKRLPINYSAYFQAA